MTPKVVVIMNEGKVIYEMTLPYPWKKLLRGGYLLTSPLIILSIIFSWYEFIHKRQPPQMLDFYELVIISVLVIVGLNILMRYLLIHGDKIKEPIRYKITNNIVTSYRGSYLIRENPLYGIREVKIVVNDKKALIDVTYTEPRGTELGWIIQFIANSTFEKREDYKAFLRDKFPEFKKILLERIRELNPNVKITEIDERKKMR